MSVSPVPTVKIDYRDILVVIMQSMEGPHRSDKKVISILSRTCRHLHLEGIKSLLARGVDLKSGDMASFAHFILADPTSRGPIIRSLELNVGAVSDNTALDVFLRALSHAVRLTRLRLDSLESLPRAIARKLCTALATLISVTDFTLCYAGGDSQSRLERDPTSGREEYFPQLLRHLQSPLTSVELWLPPMHDNEVGVIYKRDRDPIFLLSNLRASLQHVALRGNISVGGYKCVYPKVTRLSLPSSGLPLLQPYIAFFPNVTTLDVLYTMMRRYPKDMVVVDINHAGITLKEWHNRNSRNQLKYGTWTRIQSFRGTILHAYVFGICHIPRLHMLSIGGEHAVELSLLSIIFADTLPTFLRLAVMVWFGRDSLPILPPISAANQCLTELEIRINVILHEFDVDAYINQVTNMLESMRVLKSFQLELRCLNTDTRDKEIGTFDDSASAPLNGSGIYCDWSRGRCYLRDIIDHVDLYQTVREFMAAAPTLRRVTLMWKGCRHHRWDAPPDRVVGIDLDLLPHSVDRRGEESDMWWDGDW